MENIASGGNAIVGLLVMLGIFLFVMVIAVISRYRRCPSDKILVVYGKIGRDKGTARSSKCVHGGAAFIWPVMQSYQYLDLTPMSIDVNLRNALSRQNIRIDVPSRFTVGISTESGIMQNAAERLLGLEMRQIQDLAKDILFGQLRLVVATMDIEEINTDRDKFLENISLNVEAELKKIGLKLINVNVTDITDESGYIEALGKEAAAKAINDAKKSVAEKNRDGDIGKANAERDRDISIKLAEKDREIQVANAQKDEDIGKANADRDTRISIAKSNAQAVEGENLSQIEIANSEANKRKKEAEALKIATSAEKVQSALALKEAYAAEQDAEMARASKEKASKFADIVIPAQINKQRKEIEAEAEAEKIRRHAKGEADAMYYKMQAEAKGQFEILHKQAEGFDKLVQAAGGKAGDAFILMIADKMPELVRTQVDAIKNIKIDKVTVWDSGTNKEGKTSTANFISGMMNSVPPLQELFNLSGLNLPSYLAKERKEDEIKAEEYFHDDEDEEGKGKQKDLPKEDKIPGKDEPMNLA